MTANLDLSVRKATRADLPAILRLYAQPGMNDAPVLSLNAAEEILAKIARYPAYAIYVAESAGLVVGTFALLVMDNIAHLGAPSAVVEDVCVDEGQRGHGIGRSMMRFAMDLAREHACYKLSLSSNAARVGAHAFYRSLGFEQHGLSFHVKLR